MTRDLPLAVLWYRRACRGLVALAAGKMAVATCAAAVVPGALTASNPYGVPRWAPSVVALALVSAAIATARRGSLLALACASLWAAGSWAFGSALLIEAGWPSGTWWALLVPALALALPLLSAELGRGDRRLAAAVLAVLVAGAIGSMLRHRPAVAVAAALVYTTATAAAMLTASRPHLETLP